MELLNGTKLPSAYTVSVRRDGRPLLVVVAKGTYAIPADEEATRLAEQQVPLVQADVLSGEPGFSAPIYETDFAPIKPRCDVLLNGSAYAPSGRPTNRVRVAIAVGSMHKEFDVVGDRTWRHGITGLSNSSPDPFTIKAFSYDSAFGGVDQSHENPNRHRWYAENHAGAGYGEDVSAIHGKPLPNTEEPGRPIQIPNGHYRPMAFGPLGRAWQPRARLAGTYDQQWLDTTFPFLPADFQEAYFQAAPVDQQIDYPTGGELVTLIHLTPRGTVRFALPNLELPLEIHWRKGPDSTMSGIVDTIVIEPDLERLTVTWRFSVPLKRHIFEASRAIVGRMPPSWYRARQRGKTYYRSLRELAANRSW